MEETAHSGSARTPSASNVTAGATRLDCSRSWPKRRVGRSVGAALVVERREDARRERRRAAALDQPGQRVQVHTELLRQFLRERPAEAGVAKPRAAPGHYVGRFLPGPSLLSGSKVHVFLARRELALLPAGSKAGAPGRPCTETGDRNDATAIVMGSRRLTGRDGW
jgi:hypothetical protein